ncbi:MAG: UDP-glucose 4-epimerase GalE [Armatimonadetes bacterium]|nr:UDP-glucose 4-epimerase GalE [Armatimonadota bacterium]MDE2205570.1 UDP-glucose 4-epimerase GalE [Armatimonadota bacterium]
MNLLVTGGAGYIGSHYVRYEASRGHQVVVLDNLVYGHAESLPDGVLLVVGNVGDAGVAEALLRAHKIEAVVHFAAYAYVGESVTNPGKYYQNNFAAVIPMMDAMRSCEVRRFIFSSTCATYGNPQYVPLDEAHPQNPINPYGESKLWVERMLAAYGAASGLEYVGLRYFNAAGSAADGSIGESHDPETHLIPLALQAALGKRAAITVFGADYDTPDGTCVRDYIHVDDIAVAHSLALQRLTAGGASGFYNLGTGTGHSVREIIQACEDVTGKKIPVIDGARRAGDPPSLVASAAKAYKELGWLPGYRELEPIIGTAWEWELHRRY